MTLPSVTLTGHQASASSKGPLRLVVVDGPDRGKSVELASGVVRIGKSSGSDLVLTDGRVSRDHVLLTVTRDGVLIRDLGSKNGTFIGGARIQEGRLLPGATLQVGDTRILMSSALDESNKPVSDASSFGDLTGASRPMRELYALLETLAPANVSVLIEAETGCGKELCARALHDHSARKGGPYVICDLVGTSATLLESELFGHVRGAFTGAISDRDGQFAAADGGTIFLDEIGDLDVALQPKLLRALESRQVKPVGGTRYRELDLRVVAATNRRLDEEVEAGRFREDLFHRLAVVRVRIPPLRERKDDIAMLVRDMLGTRAIELPLDTLAVLTAYDWPGNVRELRNVVERGVSRLRDDKGVLTVELLGMDTEVPYGDSPAGFIETRDRLIQVWEKQALQQLLDRCGGNVARAAREGGLDRTYLHDLLKRHSLGRWAR